MIYIGLGVTGMLLVWCLVPLDQVVRADGSRCQAPKSESAVEELRGMWKMMSSRHVVALLPLFLYSNWFYSYQLGVFFHACLQASGLRVGISIVLGGANDRR